MLFLEVPQKGVITTAACVFASALLLAAVSHRLTAPLGSAIHGVAAPEYPSTTITSDSSPPARRLVPRSLGEGGSPKGEGGNPNPPAPEQSSVRSAAEPEVNLPVPFTTQAPTGDWRLPYRGACEEASTVMALWYALGKGHLSESTARREILKLVRENERTLGDAVDESVEEVQALIAHRAPQIVTRIVNDPNAADLKRELARGNVIIVPVAAHLLRNPHFQVPPPRYHMLVLRGYTADGHFITNEPGTEKGEGYHYSFEVIMEAMHDLTEDNIEEGQKVVLVVEPFKVSAKLSN